MVADYNISDFKDLVIEFDYKRKKEDLQVDIRIVSPRTNFILYEQPFSGIQLTPGDLITIDKIRVSPEIVIADDSDMPTMDYLSGRPDFHYLIRQAMEEIEEEDRKKAEEVLKLYLKKGRWERIRNPIFQRGLWRGAIAASIWWVFLYFIIGPFLK